MGTGIRSKKGQKNRHPGMVFTKGVWLLPTGEKTPPSRTLPDAGIVSVLQLLRSKVVVVVNNKPVTVAQSDLLMGDKVSYPRPPPFFRWMGRSA